jgi:hypothetical protein
MSQPQPDPTALEQLFDHYLFRSQRSMFQIMWHQFLRGLAFGLGSVIGATILVYIVVQTLSQFEFIPILGEWAVQLIDQIETRR